MVADKLEQLGEEKEILLQFKSLDKKRRVLEFVIVEEDMKEAKMKLCGVETGLNDHEEEAATDRRNFERMSLELEDGKSTLSNLKGQHDLLIIELKELEDAIDAMSRSKEALELQIDDCEAEALHREGKESELALLKEEITKVANELEETGKKLVDV